MKWSALRMKKAYSSVAGLSYPSQGLCVSLALAFGVAAMFLSMFCTLPPDSSGAAYRGLPIACLKLGPRWEKDRAWRLDWIPCLIDISFWGLILYPVLASWRRVKIQRIKRRRLEGKCLWCGYRLRGLVESRCPECGKPFDPGENNDGTGSFF